MNRKIITASVITALIAAAGIAAWLIMRNIPRENPAAEIYLNGELLKTVSLSEECEFIVDCGNGHNTVTVRDGAVSVTEADCPDKVCVRTGAISGGAVPIVCLPHRLEIRVVTGTAESVDVVV
ncbi:MAG: NusG domain II-containing protein [Ruminococcaceae bacterium]|nr:NusG domain II-containing protein [Oscillospiraceae bacterium]